ncbi:MAG: thioredoxin [Eggerthellaceae bacterium]
MATQITTSEFQEKVLNSSKPVLVDFFATWCGPCKMMAPVLDELAGEVAGKAEVYKVDVDAEPQLAQKYGIMSVPTMIIFKNGAIDNQFIGVQPKQALANALA